MESRGARGNCSHVVTAHSLVRRQGLPGEKRKVRLTESVVDAYAGGEAEPTGCLITVVMGDGLRHCVSSHAVFAHGGTGVMGQKYFGTFSKL